MTAIGWEQSQSAQPAEGVWVYELVAEKEQLMPVTHTKSIRHFWTGMQFMRTGRYSTARKEFQDAYESFKELGFECYLSQMHVRRLDIMLARPPSVQYNGIWQTEYADKPDVKPSLGTAYMTLAGTIEDEITGKGALRKKLLKKSLAMWMGPVETSNFKQADIENKAKNKLLGFRQSVRRQSQAPPDLQTETLPAPQLIQATDVSQHPSAPANDSLTREVVVKQQSKKMPAAELQGPVKPADNLIAGKRPYTKPMRAPPPDGDARSLASLLNRLPDKSAKTARPSTGPSRQTFISGRAKASRQKTLMEKKLGFSYPLKDQTI
jgi:hypothetical protein